MEQLFRGLVKKDSAEWIVEGDIKACFDETAHEWLLGHIPMDKPILKEFLKAGYVYEKRLFPTECGTPQGGLLSPILANATLNGIDGLLHGEMRKNTNNKKTDNGNSSIPRYIWYDMRMIL
jgi:RNA-directed DNA polymerase